MLAPIARRALPAPARALAARPLLLRPQQLRFQSGSSGSPASPGSSAHQTSSTITEHDTTAPLAQSPNRLAPWSPNQQSREQAMAGPRFEQMNLDDQPQPWSAIELIHQEPVRWTHERVVACVGQGGALGHPKIFINLDKPKITPCTYCGTPYANEHHRKFLESLPSTSYPLE